MLLMVAGLALFFLIHLVPTAPELRRGLIDRYGEVPYKVAFSIIALIGLAIVVVGYGKVQVNPGKNPVLWDPPLWARHVTLVLMVPAMILLVAAYIPSRIRTSVKHPMLAAVKLWALGHLLANGDMASIVLFGSFLAWAIYDRISVKKRGATGPLGNVEPGSVVNDIAVVLLGLALYGAMVVWGHAYFINVPIMPVGN